MINRIEPMRVSWQNWKNNHRCEFNEPRSESRYNLLHPEQRDIESSVPDSGIAVDFSKFNIDA